MYVSRPGRGRVRGGFSGRFILGLLMAAMLLLSYYSSSEVNPVTGETQYLSLSQEEEIALGLQAVPAMTREFGGLSPDVQAQARVSRIGARLVQESVATTTGWHYAFHVLADSTTINAFALPGGQLFITQALLDKLKSDDQVAGVLAHEISHVIARHGAQQMAKTQLTQGLSQAAVVASGDYGAGQMAAMVGQMVNMRYGREDEIESDTLGVRLMHEAGYDPEGMVAVMQVLAAASKNRQQPAEFFSTHPNPDNRVARIREAIAALQGRTDNSKPPKT